MEAERCKAHAKVKFSTKKLAREALDRMFDAPNLNAYRCSQTRAWHVRHNYQDKHRRPLKEIGVLDWELG